MFLRGLAELFPNDVFSTQRSLDYIKWLLTVEPENANNYHEFIGELYKDLGVCKTAVIAFSVLVSV
jgi:hypothetical protein